MRSTGERVDNGDRESFQLGQWRVEPRTNELARAGEIVRIEPKAMDVLVVLARQSGQVVTRDELLASVWSGTIVGDEALTQSVIKLRRALGDNSRQPKYIETISKRGYRLIAAVSRADLARSSLPGWKPWSAAALALGLAVVALIVIRGHALSGEATPARLHQARNAEASLYFASAQEKVLVRRSRENAEARTLFRKAIDVDPTFARAYSGLAMTYALESRLGGDDATARALQFAQTAALIEPAAPDVHWTLAFVQAQARRHREAIESLQKAIAIDPSFADAYALLGGIYTYVGQPGASIPLLRTAMRINPDAGYLYFLLLGRAYLFAGDAEQAIINLRAAALRNPVDVETHAFLAAALAQAGDRDGAKWETDEIRALWPGFSVATWLRSYPMTDDRQERHLAALLADVGL